MLYGKYVAEGRIQLEKTLKELQITDEGGVLAREELATIEHLLTARSGVYHAASNAGDDTASAPPRGSQQPGRYFLYNNWDFNAAGAIFEQLAGRDIYDALETDLARPIGMEDFDRSKQQKSGDPKRSKFMAYHMWLSTRDMARLGLLMLRGGDWNGHQVVPADWVRKITSLVTPFHEMNPPYQRSLSSPGRWGYGYLWWVWDAPNSWPGPYSGAYAARGAGGQFITVFPNVDAVVVHKTDTSEPSPHGPAERRRSVTPFQYDAILSMLIASYCGANCP
jgi:CubicO group peptidase (beta-lactamase class C family)